MKETPLINATGNTGPIPMPAGPFLAGMVAIWVAAIFGMIVMLFRGVPLDLYMLADFWDSIRASAAVFMGIAFLLAAVAGPFSGAAEFLTILRFLLGMLAGAGVLIGLDWVAAEPLREWMMANGRAYTDG